MGNDTIPKIVTVKIYGHSDDCIEIEGSISEEFGYYRNNYKYLHFNDGTVIRAGREQEDGKLWSFDVIKAGEFASIQKESIPEDGYTNDVMTIEGTFSSVKCWNSADGPDDKDVEEYFDGMHWGDFHIDDLRKMMLAIN